MSKRNLIGELRIMKDLGIKPNFSELQREYGTDRHTIKKYYENDGIPPRKKKKGSSKWDEWFEEIDKVRQMPHVSYKALYLYLEHQFGKDKLPGNYNSMRNYLYSLGYRAKQNSTPHPLYETPPGKQAQFDWKEDLKIHLKDGREISFNVFSLTLSYSREHIFIYSTHKTTDDLIYCLIKAINKIGGLSEEYLTDNMSAIVSIKSNTRIINPGVNALFNDLGCKLKLCKVRTPQTKGKDENANKFISWIYPYDYKLDNELQLIELIEETITSDANRQNNSSTLLPPSVLFEKEKEHLKPLPSNVLLDSYLKEHCRMVVDSTMLVRYKGKRYSVPHDYISKEVDIYPVNDELYIYFNKKLIAKHTISQQSINYDETHYTNALTKNMTSFNWDDIEEMARENLERFSAFEKERKQ